MLVGDGGISGVVIHIGNGMSKCRIEGEEVYADAGILMSTLSKKTLRLILPVLNLPAEYRVHSAAVYI